MATFSLDRAAARRFTKIAARCAWFAVACLSAYPLASHAETVMTEQQVDEAAIEHLLTPEDDDLQRGFVLKDQTGQGEPHAAPRRAAASMLITFASNSATLTSSAMAALDQVERALQSDQLAAYRFRVEGHADPRGAADTNLRLSAERASAVVAYLTSHGIAAERLSSVGKGASEPLNLRNPAAAENRRVTIVTLRD
ncbi:hypothetical protein BTHE68_56870 [Burkholderia sp. THE68]|uniref:OmpA family protein n=1 Tax=Burkholderia sp. THE68 TaxID=758782 RepID=UPI00131881E3|nr:OmpA family protein [Burkholderia sp. THE68]BBU31953.1 hypothetical protein BTHE68_56870 [Burkholderia sp. THE68]